MARIIIEIGEWSERMLEEMNVGKKQQAALLGMKHESHFYKILREPRGTAWVCEETMQVFRRVGERNR